MHYSKQSLKDFNIKVQEIKADYQRQKDSHGWEFNIQEERFITMHRFLITNGIDSTKIVYNEENQVIVLSMISQNDIDAILKLQKKLGEEE